MFANATSAHRVSQNSMNLWYGFDEVDMILPNVPKTSASWAGVSDGGRRNRTTVPLFASLLLPVVFLAAQ